MLAQIQQLIDPGYILFTIYYYFGKHAEGAMAYDGNHHNSNTIYKHSYMRSIDWLVDV